MTPRKPKEIGTSWERRCADHAVSRGLAWDRAPLRGTRDLLDMAGVLPDWLIGCKALTRTGNLADKLGPAMQQGQAARDTYARLVPGRPFGDLAPVPVQIIQRQGFPVGRAYAVMEYDDFLTVAVELRRLRNDHAA